MLRQGSEKKSDRLHDAVKAINASMTYYNIIQMTVIQSVCENPI